MIFSTLIVSLLLSTSVLAQAETFEQKVACENTQLQLRCPVGGKLVIRKAVYGRNAPGSVVCPHNQIASTSCASQTSFGIVEAKCQGQESCALSSSNSVFGDPCPGTYKYLEVYYYCTAPTTTTEETTTEELTTIAETTTTEEPTTTEEITTTEEFIETTEENTSDFFTEETTTTEEVIETTEENTSDFFTEETTTAEPENKYKVIVNAEKSFLNEPISIKNTYTVLLKFVDHKKSSKTVGLKNANRNTSGKYKGHVFDVESTINDIAGIELNQSDELMFKSWKVKEIKVVNVNNKAEYKCVYATSRSFKCKVASRNSSESSSKESSENSSEERN